MHTSGAQGGARTRAWRTMMQLWGLARPQRFMSAALPNLGRDMLTLLTKLKQHPRS